MHLREYIKRNYKNQTAFALACGVNHSQVYQWMKNDYLVIDGVLCSKRRKLPTPCTPYDNKKEK